MDALPLTLTECHGWLPAGKRAAVCFSVDDVHPATSRDEFDAGGDMGRGALGNVERLLERHPQLRVTLFVTPDWRLRRLVPTRGWLTRVPLLREHIHWAPLTPRGHFRVDRFPDFVAYLNALPRTECALHGLNHAHPGPRMAVEFQRQSRRKCSALLREARQIFQSAGLHHVPGFAAPAWSTPPALCVALLCSSLCGSDPKPVAMPRTRKPGRDACCISRPTFRPRPVSSAHMPSSRPAGSCRSRPTSSSRAAASPCSTDSMPSTAAFSNGCGRNLSAATAIPCGGQLLARWRLDVGSHRVEGP